MSLGIHETLAWENHFPFLDTWDFRGLGGTERRHYLHDYAAVFVARLGEGHCDWKPVNRRGTCGFAFCGVGPNDPALNTGGTLIRAVHGGESVSRVLHELHRSGALERVHYAVRVETYDSSSCENHNELRNGDKFVVIYLPPKHEGAVMSFTWLVEQLDKAYRRKNEREASRAAASVARAIAAA